MKYILSLLLFVISGEAYAQKANVDFVTSSIVRIQWSVDGTLMDNETGVCVYKPQSVDVSKKTVNGVSEISSSEVKVLIDDKSGRIEFSDALSGKSLLVYDSHKAETSYQINTVYDENSARVVDTANGKVTLRDVIRQDTVGTSTRYSMHFAFHEDEGLYGLGSHMEDYMNLNGKTMYLTQHNLKAVVPVLNSTRGYGLLFDAGCAMKMDNGWIRLEAAKEIDFYFIKGETMDKVIAGYRYLTGRVPMMPRYMFGYIQSKERYKSSAELISVVREYRDRHIPIDMIVQDWNYWPEGWGYMKMDPKFYPDPKALADSIHDMNAKLMVSIWPNPTDCPQADDFAKRGFMIGREAYDVFNPAARDHYWSYVNNEFFSRGFDAWWCDCSEPVDGDWKEMPDNEDGSPYGWNDHERRWRLNKDALSNLLGVERSSLYSLNHAKGIYEHQRASGSSKRVLNLTRSSYAGQQRYGTIVWNGDTYASWEEFRRQIPAGLNYMATGCPYWTVDVGSFFVKNDGSGRWFWMGDFQDGVQSDRYKEFYTRMFQWGTFLPMLRSHGCDTPREVWRFITDEEQKKSVPLKDCRYAGAILRMINLRYTLLPYVYSMAGHQTLNDYTMCRMLAFDFPSDKAVLDIKDEYMFGSILVCPVTEENATSRKVYLPRGERWMDYYTGKAFDGGQWIDADANISTIPLYVKAGSIITTSEAVEYSAAQIGKPVTINLYPGKDCSFDLYEDAGDGYDYEKGQYSIIPISWKVDSKTLMIGERKGSFSSMQQKRTFLIHTPMGDRSVSYEGGRVAVRF